MGHKGGSGGDCTLMVTGTSIRPACARDGDFHECSCSRYPQNKLPIAHQTLSTLTLFSLLLCDLIVGSESPACPAS
jgi:hypothetical protein